MAALTILVSYLLLRPLITLATELPRAVMMLRWKGGYYVTLHLGNFGHAGGLAFRMGRLMVRIHPLTLVFRGSFSDTPSQPTLRQFARWVAAPLAVGLLILSGSVYVVWRDDLDAVFRLAAAVAALLSFVDVGSGILRETDPRTMQCGLVYFGAGATIRCLFQYRQQSLHYLKGLYAYLREDYRTAARQYETVMQSGIPREDLLEDHAYATFVMGENRSSLQSFHRLEQRHHPNSTQQSVAAMALWRSGDPVKALEMVDAAIAQAYGNAIARNLRGWFYLNMHSEISGAFDLFLATKNAPEYATAWANLADCQFEIGEFEEAQKAIEQAYFHDPYDLHVLTVLHKIAVWNKDEAAAASIWKNIQILEGHFR